MNSRKIPEKLEILLPQARDLTIVVIGDLMIDRYVTGVVRRMAPESTPHHPVPVLSDTVLQDELGGTSCVASILARFGVDTHLCGVIGDDGHADLFLKIAQTRAIKTGGIARDDTRPTTIKSRYCKSVDLLLRVDDEKTHPISNSIAAKMIAYIQSLPKIDAIIVSDYGKGVVTPEFMTLLNTTLRTSDHHSSVPVLIDPKGRDWKKYSGATIITPNKKELMDVAGSFVADHDLIPTAHRVMSELNIQSILLTRSEQGMDFITADSNFHQDTLVKHRVEHALNVVGAGDHVIAMMAIHAGLRTDIPQRLYDASLLAAHHIEQGVTTSPSTSVPVPAPSANENLSRVQAHVKEWQAMGLRVGFTNGCFDILHAGHVMYLNEAKQNCDRLVVGLNSDQSVQVLKGPTRPINPEQDRKDVLLGLKAVDDVVFFGATKSGEDNTPSAVISVLQPDIFFKGGDYTIDQLPEAKVVLSYGGTVKLMGLLDGRSTTNIIQKSQVK